MLERNNLPRRTSLKRKADIDQLLRAGHKISGDLFSLVWQKSPDFSFGILISKHFGSAVKRNRTKRLIREAIRLNRQSLDHTVSIAILPKPGACEINFDEINGEINRIFKLINDRA